LQEFIESGAVTEVKNHVKGDKSLPGAAPVETIAVVAPPPAPPVPSDATAAVAPEVPPVPAPEAPATVVPPPAPSDPDDLPDPYHAISEADKAWILTAPDETERVRRLVGKRHKIAKQEEALRKQAEEEAKDAETFAKTQYDRARMAEEENAELRRKLAEKPQSPATPPPAPPEPPKAPDIKEFTNAEGVVDWDKLSDAKAKYAAEQAVANERARIAQEKQAEERARIEAEFRTRLEKAQTKYPDFLEVVGATNVLVQDAVLQFITESEYGADITYHLANHADYTDRIRKLSPTKALAEIGKLELTFEKPPVVTPAPALTPPPAPAAPVVVPAPVAVVPPVAASKVAERGGAPPPITPISAQGSGTVVTDPSKMDFKQLRAYEREKERSKRR
jgi:hypothetical protein